MDRKSINRAIAYSGKSQADVARALGLTAGAFSNRLNKCRFSAEELKTIANIIGATYIENFTFADGVIIKAEEQDGAKI